VNIAIRAGAALALLCFFAACAATPEAGPGPRAPNREEVAHHNAQAPEMMRIVCENIAAAGWLVKRRACWLRQDMDLLVPQRKTVLVPVTP